MKMKTVAEAEKYYELTEKKVKIHNDNRNFITKSLWLFKQSTMEVLHMEALKENKQIDRNKIYDPKSKLYNPIKHRKFLEKNIKDNNTSYNNNDEFIAFFQKEVVKSNIEATIKEALEIYNIYDEKRKVKIKNQLLIETKIEKDNLLNIIKKWWKKIPINYCKFWDLDFNVPHSNNRRSVDMRKDINVYLYNNKFYILYRNSLYINTQIKISDKWWYRNWPIYSYSKKCVWTTDYNYYEFSKRNFKKIVKKEFFNYFISLIK